LVPYGDRADSDRISARAIRALDEFRLELERFPLGASIVGASRRDAEKVMALARSEDPEAAAEEEKSEARERMARHRAANVRRSNDDEEQPEDGTDIVNYAFRLVKEMNGKQQEQFIAKQRSTSA
jgi:hypothetical protein